MSADARRPAPARPGDAPPPYRTVVFDCDSTLCAIEGIDELAASALDPDGLAALRALTDRAMAGEIALEEVFGARLERVRPSATDLERVGRRYVESLLPGARELVLALREAGTRVLVVSGGLLPAVRAVGEVLELPADCVHAVDVRFDASGGYLDFDRGSPLARAGGKLELLRTLGGARELGPIALVGDGATDLEAAPELARFVAFGGVVRRSAVFERARVTCTESDLLALRPLLMP